MAHPRLSVTSEAAPVEEASVRLRPKRQLVHRRLGEIGELVQSAEARDLVTSLRGALRAKGGPRGKRRMASEEGVAALLTLADASSPVERPLLIEAAAWAIGRSPIDDRESGVGHDDQISVRGPTDSGSTRDSIDRISSTVAAAVAGSQCADAWAVCGLVVARLITDGESRRRIEGAVAAAYVEGLRGFMRPVSGRDDGSRSILRQVETWARLAGVADEIGGRPWSEETDRALDTALDIAIRLLGPGRQPRRSVTMIPRTATRWIRRMARESHSKDLRRAEKRLRECVRGEPHRSKRGAPLDRISRTPPTGRSLESAGLVVLRSDWSADAVRVFIDAGGPSMRIEVASGDRLLIDGSWEQTIDLDGRPLPYTGPWEHTAHETEPSATFVEFARPLGGDLRLERQIVLLHDDHCLLLADAVVSASTSRPLDSPAAANLRYTGSLPVAASLDLVQPDETIELLAIEASGRKRAGITRLAALPLEIREWKGSDPKYAFAAKQADHGWRAHLEQRSDTARLFAPVWLDCDDTHATAPVTWRQLTVADMRINLPRHRACGYRVRSGLRQWLIYRSLDAARNRTLLGCNISCELLVGRINKNGSVDRLIEIQ